ncbi:MAG TPA: DUF1080 domain-containing protein, partial [Phycisphaerae bacterium]|nr:DUF1080 domain-containing protein [Phycisphaerae bacterium]
MLDYKAIRSLVAAGAVLAAGCATTGPSIGGAVLGSDRDGFVTIFDGSSLGDWEIYAEPEHELKPDAFYLDHGVLACNGRAGHWFRYREPLRDCVVRLEFRIARDTNSGVCMRTRKDGSPCFTGFEVQIVDDIGKAPDVHTTGAIYDVVCPMYNASRPIGEWNEMEITVAGPLVQVVLNGLKVIDTD